MMTRTASTFSLFVQQFKGLSGPGKRYLMDNKSDRSDFADHNPLSGNEPKFILA
jgi:hypothetical protein